MSDDEKAKSDGDKLSLCSTIDPDADEEGWESEVSDDQLKGIIKSLGNEHSDPDDVPTKDDPRCRKVKFLLHEFAITSTIHGTQHIGMAHTFRVILFWGILLAIAGAAFAFLFADTLYSYMQYDTNVLIKMESHERVFPAVSICNISPYKASGLETVTMLAGLVETFEYATGTQRDTLCNEEWDYSSGGEDEGEGCMGCNKIRGRDLDLWCWPTSCKEKSTSPPAGYATNSKFCKSFTDKAVP